MNGFEATIFVTLLIKGGLFGWCVVVLREKDRQVREILRKARREEESV